MAIPSTPSNGAIGQNRQLNRKTYWHEVGVIAAAYASGGYTMKEVGDYFGLHYSQVSRVVRATEQSRPRARVKT